MSRPAPCRYVRVVCRRGLPYVSTAVGLHELYGLVVRVGDSVLGDCEVSMCIPYARGAESCTVVPTTVVEFGRLVRYEVSKLSKNYKIVLDYGGATETYIYPARVWEVVNSTIVEILRSGGRLRQQGAIFYGPPGVGKTSMCRIIVEILGLNVVEVSPTTVLRKYLGESEEAVEEMLTRAEESEPSAVLLDDAEWLLMSRKYVMESSHGAAGAYLGMMNLLLDYIEKWCREGRRIVVLATTNVGKDRLDPALQRGGRLGKPIYIPLPDFEAVKELLVAYGVEERLAAAWATRIVNAGLSMADAVNVARDLLAGREPVVEPQHGVAYRRVLPSDVGSRAVDLLSKVSTRYNLPKVIAERRGRLVYHVPYDEPVSVPVAVYLFGWYLKQPILLLTDPRGVDEVIDAAESVDGFVVVPVDSYPEIVPLVSFKYSKVVLCGKTVLKVRATPIEVHTTPMDAETRQVGLAELVLTYYGLRLDPEEVDRYVKRASVESLIRVLSIVGTHGVSIRDAWSLGGVER
ncbi:MAG: ATP-binding protein [Desulfurococcaceae archaeon]|nr:ATP-binding protein [Desulfurococcaceae archaeon]